MPKKNDVLVDNIFKNKHIQKLKQIFTQKMAELINNQMEISTGIYKQNDPMYNGNQADRLVFIESPMRKRGDKT